MQKSQKRPFIGARSEPEAGSLDQLLSEWGLGFVELSLHKVWIWIVNTNLWCLTSVFLSLNK